MFFHDITGQEEIKRQLVRSVKNGHIAHAQLFGGPEGIGKFPLALAYARYIQCTDRGETDACGKCPSCLKYNTLMHPDLHFVFPVFKKDKTSYCDDFLSQWREFIQENAYFNLQQWLLHINAGNAKGEIYVTESREIIRKLSLKTYESEYKIMIIWLPEKMNAECANTLLKLIEEPYEKTVFLLVSDQPELMLETIRSRTQQINMRPVSAADMVSALTRHYSLDLRDAETVAHIANGNFIKAMETIRLTEENKLYFDLFIRFMRLTYARKINELKGWTEEVAALGRSRQKNLLAYFQRMLRENYIHNIHRPELTYMNRYELDFSARFSPFIHERNVTGLMEEFEKAENDIDQNANARIILFDLALKVIMLLKS